MLALAALLALVALPVTASAKKRKRRPQLYFEVIGVKTPAKMKAAIKNRIKPILTRSLRAHPVVADLGHPSPTGEALTRQLRRRRLRGYRIVLRVTRASHKVMPPAKGKVYKVLLVELGVAIDAEKIPSGQMALAGQGSTSVGTEIVRFKERERVALMLEALDAATRQAIAKSVHKLTSRRDRARRRHRRRRSR